MTLPTKEQAEEAIAEFERCGNGGLYPGERATLLTLARIGFEVAYGGEEVVEKVARILQNDVRAPALLYAHPSIRKEQSRKARLRVARAVLSALAGKE